MDHLPTSRLRLADHPGYVWIVVVEHVVQQERRPFLGTQTLQNGLESDGYFPRQFELHFRRGELLFDDGLGKARPTMVSAFVLELTQPVEAKARRESYQKGNGR